MPTRDEVRRAADLLVEILQKADEVKVLLTEGDQDYYTKQSADLVQASRDAAEEALGFVGLTQAGVPLEQRTTPGYRSPMNTRVRGGGAAAPNAQPRLRGASARPPIRGRGR